MITNTSSFNALMNGSETDFDYPISLADAVDYAEFEQDLNHWDIGDE